MARFKFRLQTVLTLAHAERDRCRAELAETMALVRSAEQEIEILDGELRMWAAGLPSRPGALDVERMVAHDRFGVVLRAKREQAEQRQTVLAAEVATRRELLVAADRELRSLETLHDKQQTQFTIEMNRREQRTLDEIGARGWAQTTDV